MPLNHFHHTDPLAPMTRVRDQRIDVHVDQDAVAQFRLAGDPDIGDLMPPGGVDQLRQHVMQRLGFQRRQVDAGQIGLLFRFDRTDQMIETHRPGAAERGRMQRAGGVERCGVVGHGFREQSGGAQLAEHVEIVVAGAAIGADGDGDAGAFEFGHRTKTGRKFQIRFGTMHHADPARGAQRDLGVGELGHVHGDQAIVDQAQAIQPRQRTLTVFVLRLPHFLRGFVRVQMHRDIELIREHADALEIVVRHRVRRVRREGGRDQRIVAPLVVDFTGTVEIFVVAFRPGSGEIDHRQTDARAEAVALVGRGLHVGKEVVFVAAGGPATQHFGDGQGDAVGDIIGAHDRGLDRPDVFLQPLLQRQVVGHAAHQCHRVVAVCVDQPRNQRALRPGDGFARGEQPARFFDRQQREDRTVAHRDRMVFEHDAARRDRDHVTGLDQQVAGLGSKRFGKRLIGHGGIVAFPNPPKRSSVL